VMTIKDGELNGIDCNDYSCRWYDGDEKCKLGLTPYRSEKQCQRYDIDVERDFDKLQLNLRVIE
jgi:uncharacterized protein YodC (DUF2158 family)